MTVAALVCSGVPVSNRVSTKIQQLLNTLKRPKRPPLSEFFVDDSEEIVEGEERHRACASVWLFHIQLHYFIGYYSYLKRVIQFLGWLHLKCSCLFDLTLCQFLGFLLLGNEHALPWHALQPLQQIKKPHGKSKRLITLCSKNKE